MKVAKIEGCLRGEQPKLNQRKMGTRWPSSCPPEDRWWCQRAVCARDPRSWEVKLRPLSGGPRRWVRR